MKRTIRMFSLLLALVLLLPCLPARAADPSGGCGNTLNWRFDPGSGTLTISGSGEMFDFWDYDEYDENGNYIGHFSDIPWQEYFGNITSIRLPDGLTSIGDNAFFGCAGLQSIDLPGSLYRIGWRAFADCSSLQSVAVPSSVTLIDAEAFSGCTRLQSVSFAFGVNEIGWGAFEDCARLESVSLPSSLRTIGGDAFAFCSGLRSISMPEGVERVESDAFRGTGYSNNGGNWTDGLLYLGNWLIDAQNDVAEANIRPGTVGIAETVFESNVSLKRVTFPEGLRYICDWAFVDCEALTDVKLPASLRHMGFRAFSWTGYYNNSGNWSNGLLYADNWLIEADPGIITANVRPGTRAIAAYAFNGCENLTGATLPAGLRIICEYAFCDCDKLSGIKFPDSVEFIGEGAFADCGSLKRVSLPGALTGIDESAFAYCSELTEVTIPDSVTSIGAGAFYGCDNLRFLVIPESVTMIDRAAFSSWDWKEGSLLILNRGCDIYDGDDTLGRPYSTVLYGYPGSTTEAFARKYGYPFRSIEETGFIDVAETAYYADPVAWAVERGVTNGTAPYFFSPDSTCTRAQVVTFLWRAAGSPEPGSNRNPFTDVPANQYYYKAVLWAVEQGITTGTSATRFSPDAGCTRGQVVTFLWRAMGKPAPNSTQNPFTDVDPGEYYGKAVLWAVENGITNGTSATRFSPGNTCTRGQIVTFLYRTYEKPTISPSGELQVGISMPTKDLQRWNQDGKNIQRLLKAAGFSTDLRFAANDPSLQISQIENMIAYGAQVLIVAAIDSDAMYTVLRQAREAGCAVIAYDRPIGSDAVDYYVAYDNFAVGEAQGQFIVDQLDLAHAGNHVYNIELAAGSPDDPSAYVFYDGAMSVLRPYIDAGTLKVVSGQVQFKDVATEGWSSEYAQSRFENLLTRYYAGKPLDAVMCSNDSTAQGVAAALENAYRNDVYPIITGQDCDIVSLWNIRDDKQAMSIFKDTRILADKAAETAEAVLKGAAPVTSGSYTTFNGMFTYPAIYCEPIVCTRDKIRSLLIDSGYYTADELGM